MEADTCARIFETDGAAVVPCQLCRARHPCLPPCVCALLPRLRWSEEYQAALDGIVADTVAGDDRFAGTSIWQWSDGRTGDVGGSNVLGRPRACAWTGARAS